MLSRMLSTNNIIIPTDHVNGQPWAQQYKFNIQQSENLGSWTLETPTGIGQASFVIVTSNKVYVFGSTTGGVATINSDGTIGAFSINTAYKAGGSQYFMTKSLVYFFGTDMSTAVTKATIDTDGNISAPVAAGFSLPAQYTGSQTTVTKNRVYIMGGLYKSGFDYNRYDGVKSTINIDGTITTPVSWAPTGSILYAGSYGMALVNTGNYVYLIGGIRYDNGFITTYANTCYTTIAADGSLGTWTAGPSLPMALGNARVVVTRNKVYLLGAGTTGSSSASGSSVSSTRNIYTATINSDGSLNAWVLAGTMPVSMQAPLPFITSSKLYIVKGNNVYSTPFAGGVNDYLIKTRG
jgi:hypothetical protein